MQRYVKDGIIGGLVGGVVFGLMMHLMKTPDGASVMTMVAAVVRSQNLLIGWIYHLFNSAIIGALFGLVFAERVTNYRDGAIWGLLYGVFWWVLGAQILMPILLGMSPFVTLAMAPMRSIAMGSLVGHAIYGVLLGIVFVSLRESTSA